MGNIRLYHLPPPLSLSLHVYEASGVAVLIITSCLLSDFMALERLFGWLTTPVSEVESREKGE